MNDSLPKRALLGSTIGYAALSFFAMFGPVFTLLLMYGPRYAFRHMKEGGPWMFAVFAMHLFAMLAIGVLGAFALRGKRTFGGLAFGAAFAPVGVAALAALLALHSVTRAVDSSFIDGSQAARITAMGISEVSNLFVLGDIASSFAAFAVFVAGALGVMTIDVRVAGAAAKPNVAIAPIATGVGAVLVSIVLRIVFKGVSLLGTLTILALVSATVAAAMCARPASALAQSPHAEDARTAFRSLVLSAVAIAACVLLLDRAAMTELRLELLGAISGESVDPSQKARMVVEWLHLMKMQTLFSVFDVAASLAIFAMPILGAARVAERKPTAGTIAGVLGAAVAATLALVFGFSSDRSVAKASAPYERFTKVAGLTLPHASVGELASTPRGATVLFIAQGGALTEDAGRAGGAQFEWSERSASPRVVSIAADSRVAFEAFMRVAAPALKKASPAGFGELVIEGPPMPSGLGEFAPLVGTNLFAYPIVLEPAMDAVKWTSLPKPSNSYRDEASPRWRSPDATAIAVVMDGDKARVIVVSRWTPTTKPPRSVATSASFAAGAGSELESKLLALAKQYDAASVILAPQPTDTVDMVVAQIGALQLVRETKAPSSYGIRREIVFDEIVVTSDRAALERILATPPPAILRFADIKAAGSLTPDIVGRTVRANSAKLAACNANLTTPPMPVSFVVSPAGVVTSASTSGTTSAVSACVVAVIRALVFPRADYRTTSASLTIEFGG